jgi:hypothetical protein
MENLSFKGHGPSSNPKPFDATKALLNSLRAEKAENELGLDPKIETKNKEEIPSFEDILAKVIDKEIAQLEQIDANDPSKKAERLGHQPNISGFFDAKAVSHDWGIGN